MASKVWDRDEFLKMNRKRSAEARRKQEREWKRMDRQARKGGFLDVLKIAWASVWHMGMYSSDPNMARMAMVHTAQEQIGLQRQIAAQQRAQDLAREEARDRAREAEMRQMARVMAQEMFDEAERRRTAGSPS